MHNQKGTQRKQEENGKEGRMTVTNEWKEEKRRNNNSTQKRKESKAQK